VKNAGFQTVGLTLVLGGGLILRQVAVGRAHYLRTDLRDMATAVFTANTGALTEVAARRGSNLPDSSAVSSVVTSGAAAAVSQIQNASQSTLAVEMHRLAAIANNTYVYGAQGPNAYDCSGLVWAAMHNLGYYSGPRFTTESFPNIASGFAGRVSGQAAIGDVVVWPTNPGHMGVVVGNDLMYSALNHSVGIVTSKISDIHGETPQYWRLLGPGAGQTNIHGPK